MNGAEDMFVNVAITIISFPYCSVLTFTQLFIAQNLFNYTMYLYQGKDGIPPQYYVYVKLN